jgi:hypothetical protein
MQSPTYTKSNATSEENQTKIDANLKVQRPNCKWTSIVLDWPGHLIFNSHTEATSLKAALTAAGYKAESGKMKDGRIKVWRVAK